MSLRLNAHEGLFHDGLSMEGGDSFWPIGNAGLKRCVWQKETWVQSLWS